ncbi:hypothetical protein V501_03900 [Pseudogymnoascus sp. VKM F-4519 (FW-2642)]|nr:hypothetical protein V501_03900 [Pseudogymnoascus sp. VKM F-4519 (FW-2642)]
MRLVEVEVVVAKGKGRSLEVDIAEEDPREEQEHFPVRVPDAVEYHAGQHGEAQPGPQFRDAEQRQEDDYGAAVPAIDVEERVRDANDVVTPVFKLEPEIAAARRDRISSHWVLRVPAPAAEEHGYECRPGDGDEQAHASSEDGRGEGIEDDGVLPCAHQADCLVAQDVPRDDEEDGHHAATGVDDADQGQLQEVPRVRGLGGRVSATQHRVPVNDVVVDKDDKGSNAAEPIEKGDDEDSDENEGSADAGVWSGRKYFHLGIEIFCLEDG